ncbi:MAG: chloride channel protein [Cellulosilyticaceae bacterium]
MLLKELKIYRELLFYTLIAIFVGIIVGAIDAIFGGVLIWLSNFRNRNPLILVSLLPVAGIIIITLYTKFSKPSLKGMTLVFQTGFGENDVIPKRLIPLAIMTTWITHFFGGSAGREGVSVQLGATVAHVLGERISLPNSSRILLITGMAAGFGGLFQTPLAATFFALEVLVAGALQYEALLPALVSAYFASYTSHFLGLEKFSVALGSTLNISLQLVIKVIMMGIIFGIVGGVFAHVLVTVKKYLVMKIPSPMKRIFIMGSILAALFLTLYTGRYCGLGTNLINESFSGGTIFYYDWLLKLILTILTLAAGYQGGEVTPLFAIGASLGVVLGKILGLPIMFTAALGYIAVFASATNTLLAPILIGVEVFGTDYILFFTIICSVAYVFNGAKTIYTAQRKYSLD